MKLIDCMNFKDLVKLSGILIVSIFLRTDAYCQDFTDTIDNALSSMPLVGTWTVPSHVTSIKVQCWGAGGAGGGATGQAAAGGGGSGGAYAEKFFLVTSGQIFNYSVGGGGTRGFSTGGNGGDTWFGSSGTFLARGGLGGSGQDTHYGTASGAPSVTSGNIGGLLNFYGGSGGTGNFGPNGSEAGGGGGAAGSSGNGSNGYGRQGGNGGAGGGGNGAWAGAVGCNCNGNAGVLPGGAGSGGQAGGVADKLGGSGGGGRILVSYEIPGVGGDIYADQNADCLNNNEIGLEGVRVILQPGNRVTETNSSGEYIFNFIPSGTYTIYFDTTLSNLSFCVDSINVNHLDSTGFSNSGSVGVYSQFFCSRPAITVSMPIMRRGSTRPVYVRACNLFNGTDILDSAYVHLTLPSELQVQSASLPYTSLGGNRFKVLIGDLNPGQCVNFTLNATVTLQSALNQTLCLEAELFPQATCVFDSIPTPYGDSTVTPCTLPWDRSSLRVEGSCVNNDSIRFVIYNTGDPVDGDMDCWAPVRVYIDGVLTILDSIRITGGDSVVYMFAGDGRTWRLEADQHPLHPGNSHPNASVENCGSGAWTPNIINQLPQDDADPVVDIYCGVVTAPVDPNDKTGFPLGVGAQNIIQPGQQMEYLVRFQNTGTDTAFTVIIRDTLDPSLSVFSVTAGVASHPYNFRMYGPRVLEWTFDNIQLPDSNVDEPNSHGFVKLMVDMEPGTPLGTVINNTAAIYFDFEAPVITNTTMHTVGVFELPTSSEHAVLGEMDIAVYPNPTTGILKVVHDGSAPLNLRLVDPLGRVLKAFSSESAQIQLDLSSYSDGIYHLVLSKGDSVLVKKVVKR